MMDDEDERELLAAAVRHDAAEARRDEIREERILAEEASKEEEGR